MSGNDNDNDNEFPYGKYPSNLLKLFEKSYENRMEKKENYYIVLHGGKDLTPQIEPQILMDLCVEAYKTKGKFLHEMDKDEVKQIMKDFE